MELFPEPPEAVQAAMDAGNNADDGRFDDDSSVQDIIMLAQGMDELPAQGMPLKQRLAEIERNYISQALELSEGNVSKTAKLLSLQRTTLIEKINKYELRVA